jgi:hypothetical protein
MSRFGFAERPSDRPAQRYKEFHLPIPLNGRILSMRSPTPLTRRRATCHPHQRPFGADDRSRNSTNPHSARLGVSTHTQGDEAMLKDVKTTRRAMLAGAATMHPLLPGGQPFRWEYWSSHGWSAADLSERYLPAKPRPGCSAGAPGRRARRLARDRAGAAVA